MALGAYGKNETHENFVTCRHCFEQLSWFIRISIISNCNNVLKNVRSKNLFFNSAPCAPVDVPAGCTPEVGACGCITGYSCPDTEICKDPAVRIFKMNVLWLIIGVGYTVGLF